MELLRNARIRVEHDSNLVFNAIKRKLICEKYDKHHIQTDPTAKCLLVHENTLIVKDGISMRKYYGKCGQVTHHQILIPDHLITEILRSILGQMGKYTGITKTIQECRSNYYYPRLAKRIKQCELQCEDCIKYKKKNKNCQIRPKMINNTEHVLESEDSVEIDILPNLPNSARYQNIVTMIDVFSCYLFAYPTPNVTAKTIGRCIVDVMTRHAYLPTLIL